MEKPESDHIREEREWLNEYTGRLKGMMYDPPKAVSHPQHADAVMSWMTALKKIASARVSLAALESTLIRIAREPLDAEQMAAIAERALTGSECGTVKGK